MAQGVKRPIGGGYRRSVTRRDFASGLVLSDVGDQAARRPQRATGRLHRSPPGLVGSTAALSLPPS
jgi:hypothetical protein